MSVWVDPVYCLMAERISGFVDTAHGNARRAGWWGVVSDGENIPLDVKLVRDDDTRLGKALVAQKLCLIHSEISEAMEGHRKGLMDDKLPHRKMIEVELADAYIRIADLAGALGLDLGGAIVEKMEYNSKREDHKLENRQKAGGKAY
jgi:NTP pyrophosphatase (non-canonical NTP hydrolase)